MFTLALVRFPLSFSMMLHHPSSTLFPYTTLFRSDRFSLPRESRQYVQALDGLVTRLHVLDRKSTRLNSSHLGISYAVFCLKKKNMITLTLVRFSPIATKEIQSLNDKGTLIYTDIA